jgi:outer membrane protein assembly factor BamA
MTHKTSGNTAALVLPRTIALFSVFVIIIAFAVALAQQPSRKITKIEIEGLARLSAEEVVATSGLKTGAPFSVADLDAAGQKLVDSGLFAKVGYRTNTKGNLVTIVFQVEEAKSGQSAVVFDNFVWFTNDELVAAIKREVPSFNGLAPDSGKMTDAVSHALQTLLKEHQIEGTVEYAPWQRLSSGAKQEHLFSVTGVQIPICKLHFPGATNVSEEKLVKSSRQLTDADYSLKSTIAFVNIILFPIYREVGQLRANFAEPISKFEGAANCKGGVDLSVPVEEGPIYLWDKAEWSGNEALSGTELDAALGMKQGELANGIKFDKGLVEVDKRYGRTGHLDVRLGAQPEFDDTASRVTYKIVVKEGPQYRMGKLTIKGLSEADSKSLEQSWKLKSGEVFDSSYFERFLKTDAREEMQRTMRARQAQGKGAPQISHETIPNRQTLTADVTVEFKN